MNVIPLSFAALRGANAARLPQFKNKHGAAAHTTPNGSDWTPAQWLQALLGEVGEFARVRLQFEAGELSPNEYHRKAASELADIATYLDLLAQRALDLTAQGAGTDAATLLMQAVATLGEYANERKKFDRGDIDATAMNGHKAHLLPQVADNLIKLRNLEVTAARCASTLLAHPQGVDLGGAVLAKFNEVSERVGSTLRLTAAEWHHAAAPAEQAA